MTSQTVSLNCNARRGTGADLLMRLSAWLRQRREVRRSKAELSVLDDRLLADIGIERHEMGEVARLGHLPGWR